MDILHKYKPTIMLIILYLQRNYFYIFLTFKIFWWDLVKLYLKPLLNSIKHIVYTPDNIIKLI